MPGGDVYHRRNSEVKGFKGYVETHYISAQFHHGCEMDEKINI